MKFLIYSQLLLLSLFRDSFQSIENDVKIYFFHGKAETSVPLKNITSLLNRKQFDRNKPTLLYIHGYTENRYSDSSRKVVSAFQQRKDYNFLYCDWGAFSVNLYLTVVVPDLQRVSIKVADYLNKFFNDGCDYKKFHIVGHSLGAQSAGLIGRHLKKTYGKELPRLTGLDPAAPAFYPPLYSNFKHISPSDAKFVDIIHTDDVFLGTGKQTGTADFYPNGGSGMPGCNSAIVDIKENPLNFICSHSKSVEYFAESLRKADAFLAAKAKSYKLFKEGKTSSGEHALMGIQCPTSARGKFFLQTNEKSPYGRGSAGIVFNRALNDEDEDYDEWSLFPFWFTDEKTSLDHISTNGAVLETENAVEEVQSNEIQENK